MSLTKRIIPCLDVAGGRVVKGLHFESLRDAGDPVELAKRYSEEGADELVFLDITASTEGRDAMTGLVREAAQVIEIPFTAGGGINSLDGARNMLLNGADKVALNTGAVKNPSILTSLMDLFGRQCVVAAIDAKRNYGEGGTNHFEEGNGKFWYEVYVYGGKKPASLDVIEWAGEAQRYGAGEILLTSIDKDGTKTGYDITLTSAVSDAVGVPVVASGGCGSPEDMADVLNNTGASAALAASIFHYDSYGMNATKRHLQGCGIPVRL